MNKGQFRFAYFTAEYESTVAFYRDGLEFAVLNSWDRGPDDCGTLFSAASGFIEVLASPGSGAARDLGDDRPPQGAFMVIEMADLRQTYLKCVKKKLFIQQELTVQPWGHLSFSLKDPNGLTVYLFSAISGPQSREQP